MSAPFRAELRLIELGDRPWTTPIVDNPLSLLGLPCRRQKSRMSPRSKLGESGSKLAKSWPTPTTIGQMRPKSDGFRQMSADFGRSWPEVGRNRPQVCQKSAKFPSSPAKGLPKSIEDNPNLAELGPKFLRISPNVAKSGQVSPIWPLVPEIRGASANFAPSWAESARSRPLSTLFRPMLPPVSGSRWPTTPRERSTSGFEPVDHVWTSWTA